MNIKSKLLKQLDDLESLIEERDRSNPKVSKVDVAWHLDHLLKVINQIHGALKKSDPEKYQGSFTFMGRALTALNYIPRGVGRNPKSVAPPSQISTDSILQQLELARNNIEEISEMENRRHFKHPYFGCLNKNQTMRFLRVHTHHHLKIIKDILSNS